MSGEIRMAALQGLLTGPHRSPVQLKALLLKQYLDVISEASSSRNQRTEALKLAMGASGAWKFESLFPEAFGKEAFTTQEAPSESETEPGQEIQVSEQKWADTTALDYSGVQWKSPTQDKAEYDEIMRKLAALSGGSMNGTQITTRPKFPMEGQWR